MYIHGTGVCDPCLMCWLVSSPVDKRARFEVSGRVECWGDDGPICPWPEGCVQLEARPRSELACRRTGAAVHARERASTRRGVRSGYWLAAIAGLFLRHRLPLCPSLPLNRGKVPHPNLAQVQAEDAEDPWSIRYRIRNPCKVLGRDPLFFSCKSLRTDFSLSRNKRGAPACMRRGQA